MCHHACIAASCGPRRCSVGRAPPRAAQPSPPSRPRRARASSSSSSSCSSSSSSHRPAWQQRRGAAAAAATAAAAPPPAAASRDDDDGGSAEADELAELRRLVVAARGADEDASVVAREAASALAYLASQRALPPGVERPADLLRRALHLTQLLASGGTLRTLAMVKRHPGLLALPPDVVAARVLALKLALPPADVPRLLYQRPSLLLLPDAPRAVAGALAQLAPLMPGIDVEARLHEGGTVFWSFASLLDGGGGGGGLLRAASSSSPGPDGS